MPNSIFSRQTTLKKVNFLDICIKNANLATLSAEAGFKACERIAPLLFFIG